MTAPSRQVELLPETAEVESRHAEVKRKLEELERQFKLQEQREYAEFEDKLKAIDAEFRSQRDEIALRLDPPLRDQVEQVLKEKRDLKASELERLNQLRKDDRKRDYDRAKQDLMSELFAAITALMEKGTELRLDHSPAPQASVTTEARHAVAAPALVGPLALSKTESKSASAQDTVFNDPRTGSPDSTTVHARGLPAVGLDLTPSRPPDQSAADPASTSVPASPSEPPPSAGSHEQSFADAETVVEPDLHPAQPSDNLKRKAYDEPNDESLTDPGHPKRSKSENLGGAVKITIEQPGLRRGHHPVVRRTITFNEVFEDPQYHHIIVEHPQPSGNFYILKCDEHGVHFGEQPLRGAAKHLAGAQHGRMNKEYTTAIDTLGHLVVDCTPERMKENNKKANAAFAAGYKPLNANTLSQAKRAEMGLPPLETPSSQAQKAARPGSAEITSPVSGEFYVALSPQINLRCPVLILPWGSLESVGLAGTLSDTGIFTEHPDIPKPPKCYIYERVQGRITGIRGWANGYEDHGPLIHKREFPVLCADNPEYHRWSVGWVRASNLSALDFRDPSSETIPFFREARHYYSRIQAWRSVNQRDPADRHGSATALPWQAEQARSGPLNATAVISSDFPGPLGDTAFKGTSGSTSPPAGNAQLIAAQALSLQPPRSSGFKAINAGRSVLASREPPSSVSTGHWPVEKGPNQDLTLPPIVSTEARSTRILPPIPIQPEQPMRKHSPASLQNIVQGFPAEGSSSSLPRREVQPQLGPVAQAATPPAPAVFANLDAQPSRDIRAGSAPVPQTRLLEAEERRAESVAATIGHSGTPTPRPPPLTLTRPGTPSAVSNATATTAAAAGDVFDLSAIKEGEIELFNSKATGSFLRLTEDPETGMFRSAADAPVALEINPMKVRSVVRSLSQTGAVCMATLVYDDRVPGATGGLDSDSNKTQTLVFETARSTASGMQTGAVHARRFCRRLKKWNPEVVIESL